MVVFTPLAVTFFRKRQTWKRRTKGEFKARARDVCVQALTEKNFFQVISFDDSRVASRTF